ncbi:MAG: dihydropteroate synthase [bacterium]
MTGRIIELENLAQAERELLSIGCDKQGVGLMSPKAVSRVIKLKNIKPVAANIIKQEMLSYGGEAATAYGSVNQSVEVTDLLIFGTLKQLRQLISKLSQHQFGLPGIGQEIERMLANYDLPSKARTLIMGILNVTPDSFSDGGKFLSVEAAVAQAEKMIAGGADIIDVGGESTRPGAEPVSAEEEKKRVLPVIKELVLKKKVRISIDTTKADVAEAALTAGAAMVNDVSCLRADSRMARVVAAFKVPVCIMHMQGTPGNMQENPAYNDLMSEIINYLAEGLAIAKKAGILHEQIIVDPGIGFGKTVAHNLEILRRLRELKVLGCPILVGTSRKSVIGQVLDLPAAERLEGTAATVTAAIMNGANIVRVHDVKEMARAAKMTDAMEEKNG